VPGDLFIQIVGLPGPCHYIPPAYTSRYLSLSQPSMSSCQAHCVGKQTNAITRRRVRQSKGRKNKASAQVRPVAKLIPPNKFLTAFALKEIEAIEIAHVRILSARYRRVWKERKRTICKVNMIGRSQWALRAVHKLSIDLEPPLQFVYIVLYASWRCRGRRFPSRRLEMRLGTGRHLWVASTRIWQFQGHNGGR